MTSLSPQVPVSPFDNALALDQIEVAYSTLLTRPVFSAKSRWTDVTRALAKDGTEHPRIIRFDSRIYDIWFMVANVEQSWRGPYDCADFQMSKMANSWPVA